MKALAIVSGGMDSVTMAYLLLSQGYDLHLLSFDYGQRHRKELQLAATIADALAARHDIIDLSAITPFLKGSALTDDIPVPDGHYAEPSMRITVVPNRNAIMLAVAYAVALTEEAKLVGLGVHAGDHPIYPDCRPEFIKAFDAMERYATDGQTVSHIHLYTPFVNMTKTEIVAVGHRLGVPFEKTWSCYKGGDVHCGVCGTCVERREAFNLAGVYDPTIYQGDL